MIHHYRLIIQYKGTRYLGWQVQPSHYGETIQGRINDALRIVSKTSDIKSLGAGRTDAGVHALGQVVKISIPLNISPRNLIPALNVNLPDDIRVIEADISDESFIPTVNALSKEYQYKFTANRMFNALQNDFIANYPFDLDIEIMREACKILIGRHNFLNFYTEGTEVSSTVREILHCEIEKIENPGWEMFPPYYNFKIVGTGFLKQMVRLLVGAIWNIGRGKVSLEHLKLALGSEKMNRLGPVAPPQGLYLVRVNY